MKFEIYFKRASHEPNLFAEELKQRDSTCLH